MSIIIQYSLTLSIDLLNYFVDNTITRSFNNLIPLDSFTLLTLVGIHKAPYMLVN